MEKVRFEVFVRRQSLPFEKNMTGQLSVAKLYFNKPQDLWNNPPWVDTTKMEMFAQIEQHHMLAYQ